MRGRWLFGYGAALASAALVGLSHGPEQVAFSRTGTRTYCGGLDLRCSRARFAPLGDSGRRSTVQAAGDFDSLAPRRVCFWPQPLFPWPTVDLRGPGLAAGAVMAILALAFGQPLAVSLRVVPGIVASGAISLGLSLALFHTAMRYIGAGRTGLISSTSVFWGVVGALILLAESLTAKIITGGLLMVLGLALFAWEASDRRA
ncbi:MAG TPA: DMT family transporter [Symbiobacteriaceae bacterium]